MINIDIGYKCMGVTSMLIDLHIHESTYSLDSKTDIYQIIKDAKEKGLDAVCITDHESNSIKEKAKAVSEELNYPVFVGMEFLTNQGDIVAIGLDEVPKEKLDAQEFIDLVHANGGVCISAHPYRNNNRGLEDNLKVVKGLDAIEGYNGSTTDVGNQKAVDVAKELGIQYIGSSDSHYPGVVGRYATVLPFKVLTEEELIKAIKTNKCKAAKYEKGKYIIL